MIVKGEYSSFLNKRLPFHLKSSSYTEKYPSEIKLKPFSQASKSMKKKVITVTSGHLSELKKRTFILVEQKASFSLNICFSSSYLPSCSESKVNLHIFIFKCTHFLSTFYSMHVLNPKLIYIHTFIFKCNHR